MSSKRKTSELPASWRSAALDELGEWFGGGTPDTRRMDFWQGGTHMWVSPKDMKADVIRSTEDHITMKAITSSSTKLVPAQSVLMVTRSGILKHSFPVATVEASVTLNQDLRALAPRPGIESRYIAYGLRAFAQAILQDCSKDGTTVQSIETSNLKRFSLPIAPTNEQKRIVAKIDELFSGLEAGEKALERAGLLVKRYRQSVLKAAVTGELTKDWRAKNLARLKKERKTGADLLADILEKRCEAREAAEIAKVAAKSKPSRNHRWKQRYVEPARRKIDDLLALPEGWIWSTVGELFQVFVGTTPSRSEPKLWGGNIPWVSSGEVAFSRIRATREAITEEGLGNPSTRLHPSGTVMLAMIGEGKTRGQAAILDIAAAHNQNAASIRVSETTIPSEYVLEFLRERYERTRRGGQGGNQPALNKGIVEAIPLPLPPLEEIEQIVKELELTSSIVEAAEQTIEAQKKRSQRLRHAILSAAFSGILVAQDTREEPAAVLLERIQAERGGRKPAVVTAKVKTARPKRRCPKKVTESGNPQGEVL